MGDLSAPHTRIVNQTRHTLLADRAAIATTFLRRATGLLGRHSLDDGEALLLPSCNSIHTWGMRVLIDVVFLKHNAVVKLIPNLKPFRLAWSFVADTVLELPAGTLARTSTEVGDTIRWVRDPLG